VTPTPPRGRPRILLVRIVRARLRLFIAGAVGIVAIAALAAVTDWRGATRLLAGWDLATALYLALTFQMMAGSDVQRIRRYAAEQDEGQIAILVLTVGSALASVGAIFVAMGSSGSRAREPIHIALPMGTILLSWVFIHTIFALHYAHEFYDENAPRSGGMAFPGGEAEPDYWDFVYFSFVIGMTAQVADVGVASKRIRRTVTAHSVVAFLFNTALLALTINLAASAMQEGP
jgi:uncharacterized membrane protein